MDGTDHDMLWNGSEEGRKLGVGEIKTKVLTVKMERVTLIVNGT
jgi:hypothetical protein